MKSRDVLVVNFTLDWRLLLVLGLALIVMLPGHTAAVAQGGDPPVTNSQEADPPAGPPDPAPEDDIDIHCDGDLLLTVNGECVPPSAVGTAPVAASASATVATGSGRHVYLTHLSYATDQPLGACASGYHMASLWEILDISNLIYDYDHPAAHKKTDSGYGPPSHWYGWVRTGWSSSNSATAGEGNCNAWTSKAAADHGVSVRLSYNWETAPGDIATWDATSFPCNTVGPVWCVRE